MHALNFYLPHNYLMQYKGLMEPNHGSDPGSMETIAEEVDGGFIINGSKTWISNAPVAYVFLWFVGVLRT